MPSGVHIGPVSHKQLHHGRSRTIEACPHERRIAPFVNVRTVVDKPLCYIQPSFGRLSCSATFSSPGQRSISAVADWGMFQFGVFRKKMANLSQVIKSDCFFQVFREW
jgi:hypothetical protein